MGFLIVLETYFKTHIEKMYLLGSFFLEINIKGYASFLKDNVKKNFFFNFISFDNSFEVSEKLKERHQAHVSGSEPGAV